jgi:hypothetical protein
MNRLLTVVGMTSLLVLAGGCQTTSSPFAPVVGTWTATGQGDDKPFTFGSVSFVGDRTFTAEAKYGGQSRVQSGMWRTEGNKLMLDAGDAERSYTYKRQGDELVVTEPKSGNSVTLRRMRK